MVEEAKKIIERLNISVYGHLFEVIEDFIDEHHLLTGEYARDEKFQYHIYCDNALRSANELANLLAEKTQYVEMLTNIPYKKFTIMADTKYICTLYTLGFFKKQPVRKYLGIRSSHIPIELELIDVYHKLYSIEHADQWDGLKVKSTEYMDLIDDNTKRGGSESDFLSSLGCVVIGHRATQYMGIQSHGRLQLLSDDMEETKGPYRKSTT